MKENHKQFLEDLNRLCIKHNINLSRSMDIGLIIENIEERPNKLVTIPGMCTDTETFIDTLY